MSVVAPASWGGLRRLLKRLRDVMASEGDPQGRLDRVVKLISHELAAEVCSVYLLRAGEVLELFATEGLKQEAVHNTRLRVGEGLIGDTARQRKALAIADAWSYPNFAYRPETGEELYHSFLGVPIRRDGKLLGVLAVQHKEERPYGEEEVETLETVAMVMAELITAGAFVAREEVADASDGGQAPRRLEGTRINAGVALGKAVLHRPRIEVRQMVADDPGREQHRLEVAVRDMLAGIDRLIEGMADAAASESRDVLETYRMFAEDRGWLTKIKEAVRGGLTAEAAVLKVQNDMRGRMREVTDPYLRERLIDLEDLAFRLLAHLTGADLLRPSDSLPDEAIVIARSMGPAELLDYDRGCLKGLVLEEGSPTSHVAIVARALDIPVMGRVGGILDRIEAGDDIVIDADNGQVFLRPGPEVQASVRDTVLARAEQKARYAVLKNLPSVTRDGVAVTLLLNAGLLIDLGNLDETGAEGVGLYRTEIPFMVRSTYPDVATQAELYSRILERAGTRPVIFRTLDIGGDKTLPYFHAGHDENPAMGWRAIRIGLDRPFLLRQQLRAMIRAASGRPLHVMFPMITTIGEFERAKDLLDLELSRAEADEELLPSRVQVGTMIEVPALMWQLPELLARVDFVSVGSNDLMQFIFAADRGSAELGDRYDVLSPPALRLLRDLVRAANSAGKPITLCGEVASRPLEAMVLLGLGYRRLSMPAGAVGPVKMMLRSLELAPLRDWLDELLDLPTESLRSRLLAYARERGVAV